VHGEGQHGTHRDQDQADSDTHNNLLECLRRKQRLNALLGYGRLDRKDSEATAAETD
jgi:hypothetical protein